MRVILHLEPAHNIVFNRNKLCNSFLCRSFLNRRRLFISTLQLLSIPFWSALPFFFWRYWLSTPFLFILLIFLLFLHHLPYVLEPFFLLFLSLFLIHTFLCLPCDSGNQFQCFAGAFLLFGRWRYNFFHFFFIILLDILILCSRLLCIVVIKSMLTAVITICIVFSLC